MRRLLTGIVVTLGIAALLRRLRRRKATEAESSPPDQDPADELRAKLAETRADEETPAEPPTSATVEERRAEVHEQGRSAVDEMRKPDES
jgi:hypothetical protein